jgi:hypothetical protein
VASLEERAGRLAVVRLNQPGREAHDPCTHLSNAHRIRTAWCDRLLAAGHAVSRLRAQLLTEADPANARD